MDQIPLRTLNTLDTIRPELNIEKWIVFTTSTFKGKSKEFVRTITLPDGEAVRQVVVGRINKSEVGVLRMADLKVYCALVKLWEQAGRPEQENVSFAVHEIASILGWSWGGKTYQQIKEILVRLANIPIIWHDSFYQKETGITERLISNFHILDTLRIYERVHGDQLALALSSFRFNDLLLKNLLANHTKPLYLDTILGFTKEISILLYRHLDLIMADKDYYERRSKLLLEDDLQLSESYVYPSQRKRLLEPTLQELRGCRFSTGILCDAKIQKTSDGKDYKVIFRKATEVPKLPADSGDGNGRSETLPPEEQELFLLLLDRKIGAKSALKMVKSYPDKIREKIEIFDWLIQNSREKIQSPTGFLRRMIEEDWPPPEGFISQAEQEEQTRKAEERQKELQRQEDTRRAAEAQVEQARQQRREASPWGALWEPIANHLAQRMPRQNFSIWIQPLFLADLQDNAIVIDCPSRFIKEYVEEKYRSLIEDAVATVCGEGKQVTFVYKE